MNENQRKRIKFSVNNDKRLKNDKQEMKEVDTNDVQKKECRVNDLYFVLLLLPRCSLPSPNSVADVLSAQQIVSR